jgi:hypothetical protein
VCVCVRERERERMYILRMYILLMYRCMDDFAFPNLQLETFLSGVTELPKREKKCVG